MLQVRQPQLFSSAPRCGEFGFAVLFLRLRSSEWKRKPDRVINAKTEEGARVSRVVTEDAAPTARRVWRVPEAVGGATARREREG